MGRIKNKSKTVAVQLDSRYHSAARIALFDSDRAAAIESSIPITGAASSLPEPMDQRLFLLEAVHSSAEMLWKIP